MKDVRQEITLRIETMLVRGHSTKQIIHETRATHGQVAGVRYRMRKRGVVLPGGARSVKRAPTPRGKFTDKANDFMRWRAQE